MTPREQLQAIQDRARSTGETREVPGVGHVATVSITRHELVTMVAALRAVLDIHSHDQKWIEAFCAEDGELLPCPTTRAITEALS